jgi:hypothetical protein
VEKYVCRRLHNLRKVNKQILVVLAVLFVLSVIAYGRYQAHRRELPLPHRYKSTCYEKPAPSPLGLYYEDGAVWISSAYYHALLKYDLKTKTVVSSIEVPCFEAAGVTSDGETFWVCDYSKRTIHQISPDGDVLNSYKTPYSTPYGITWDGTHLWILDVYGLKDYPDVGNSVYPAAIIYQYEPETGTVLTIIKSPVPFAGDIAYKDGHIMVTGCTSRKIFHVDINTKETTFWYYPPDTFPRAVAPADNNKVFVTGMGTRDIWEVTLNEHAQYKDFFRLRDITVPLWLVIVFSLVSLPVLLDEIMKKEVTKKKNVWEKPPKWYEFWKE